MRSSGIRPNLSPEDRDVKRKLAKCLPRAYSELIRSDNPGSSSSKSSRPSTLRPSPPSFMKFSHERPPVVKPTKEELRARVETLSRRPRSVKQKSQDSLEKSHSVWVKPRGWGRLLHHPLPMSKCKGKHCHLRSRCREHRFHSLALPLLQRPKIPHGGLQSLRWRLCLSQFGVLMHRALSLLLRYRKTWGGSASELMEMRIPCFPMRSLLLTRSHLSSGILISRGRMPCLLRRLWLYHSKGSPP